MGQYDTKIADLRARLPKAEKELADATLQMADAAPNVREFVLSAYRRDIKEIHSMIEIFTQANDE